MKFEILGLIVLNFDILRTSLFTQPPQAMPKGEPPKGRSEASF